MIENDFVASSPSRSRRPKSSDDGDDYNAGGGSFGPKR